MSMKIGPRYKIARRLGSNIFEKTQSPKFAEREARRSRRTARSSRQRTEYGVQMLEKQKARFMYGVSECQFGKYVLRATSSKGGKPSQKLYESLEMRLDNVIYRAGFAPTRMAARQAASHGHFTVNGKRVTIASYKLSVGDKVKVREGSSGKALFALLEERLKGYTASAWLKTTLGEKEIELVGLPNIEGADIAIDLKSVLEFYSR